VNLRRAERTLRLLFERLEVEHQTTGKDDQQAPLLICRNVKTASWFALVIAPVAFGGIGRGDSGAERQAYVAANEAVFRQLPIFPGARLRKEESSPAYAGDGGEIVGYTTLCYFDLPSDARADDVAAFFRRRLEPRWRLVEKLDGPVLNFRQGRSIVSVNLEGWRTHMLEVAVNHRD
jgi:hypothetical protein